MSAPLTRAAMHVRVRRMFLEELGSGQSTDFVNESQTPDEIDQDWDEACQEQHLLVLDAAEKMGRLEDYDNEYLRRYLCLWNFSVTRGTFEYSGIPSDVAKMIKIEIDGLRGIRKAPYEDRMIRTWPSQYGPGNGEFFWIVMSKGLQSPPDPADVSRLIRLYEYGDVIGRDVAVPIVSQTAELTFYRLVRPISYNSPPLAYTDVEDPWAEGPIHGTVARLQEKAQQGDQANAHYAYARNFALMNIMGAAGGAQPPQQGGGA